MTEPPEPSPSTPDGSSTVCPVCGKNLGPRGAGDDVRLGQLMHLMQHRILTR